MKVVANPHDQHRLGDFLLDGLRSDAVRFDGAVAFARRSGVRHLAPAIRRFSAGRPFHLVVGIDLHSTSIEALEMLLDAAGENAHLHIFYNPAATFHPKLFRFEHADHWQVYCGSGNLTKSGLFENYEIGLLATLAKSVADDEACNDRLGAELARWTSTEAGSAKVLTAELIKQLADSKLILPEARIRNVRAAAQAAVGAPESDAPLFPTVAVPGAPPPPKWKPLTPGPAKAGAAPPGPQSGRLRQPEAALLMLRIAATMPKRRATTGEMIERAPTLFTPSAVDRQPSRTRPKQPQWHQIIRNVISHRDGRTSLFALGLAKRIADGLVVTDKGIKHLRDFGYPG